MTPILSLGYTRALEADDLYETLDSRGSALFAKRVNESFGRRRAATPKQPAGNILMGALSDAFGHPFWLSVTFKTFADVGTMCSPLLIRALTSFSKESYGSPSPPAINRGVGLVLGFFFLQLAIVLFNAHAFYRSFGTGVLIRGALIHLLFSKALLHSHAEAQSTAKLFTLISSDLSRLDFACGYLPVLITGPVQLAVCLGLLVHTMSWPAVPGFMLIILVTPLQGLMTRKLFILRHRSMKWTEKRISAIRESVGNMRVVKWFVWEVPYLNRISQFRHQEMIFLRTRLVWRSMNNAFAFSLPTMASVVSIVVYAHEQNKRGEEMDAGVIFSALAWFQLMRVPMQFLPIAMNALADARSALDRIGKVLIASIPPPEEGSQESKVESDDTLAVNIASASFTWPTAPIEKKLLPKKARKTQNKVSPSNSSPELEKPASSPAQFSLRDITLSISKGTLCSIVGPVGAGKSTLVGGLVGETMTNQGSCSVNGDVAYCSQSAWIQSATIRDNILFGLPFDQEKYERVLEDCCLVDDLKILPKGDQTQVGEKGASLSGGQKQRVNIARAIYHSASITILDDSFSALDVKVSAQVFDNLVRRHKKEGETKTLILVTHSLTLAKKTEFVVVMDLGRIVEMGACNELLERNGAFKRMVDDFGTKDVIQKKDESEEDSEGEENLKEKEKVVPGTRPTDEERFRGGVSWRTYKDYLFAAHIKLVLPLIVLVILAYQGSSVMANYWLVLWQRKSFDRSEGFYMGIYAALGVGQAIGMFCMGVVFAIMTYYSSKTLHGRAMQRLMHAPISFFDMTPLGRIINRLSKDIDTIDNIIGDAIRMFIGTLVQIIGAVVLISILQPYFLIAVSVISIFYYWYGAFYRPSAREIRRLDALLRSTLYAHFSESLAGASTIRAYGAQSRFIQQNAKLIDIENRAYWLSIANQRWLSVRLDALGSLLILAVGFLVVGARFEISPAKTGVMLSYILTVQTTFGWMIRHSAEVENNMNAVERVLYYADNVPQESLGKPSAVSAPRPWPQTGDISMEEVEMRHRPELPPALDRISLRIESQEHLGIIGRTGAGKSSLVSALFRLTELSRGKILIDGVDIAMLPLDVLRGAIAMIPQDPQLFSGTLRSNLDPFNTHDDMTLNAALRDAWLLDDNDSDSQDKEALSDSSTEVSDGKIKLSLDSEITEDGANLSLGQRSLVALARALVKNSKIVVLDEATASIDYSTERHIQRTLSSSFNDRTLLCIAHRLQTILGFDKICVLDQGSLVEYGTVFQLYEKEGGIFRGMCEQAGIGREELNAAHEHRMKITSSR